MRQIFVDSRDRVKGTSSDFTIQLPTTLVLGEGSQARIDDIRIPMVIPTIQEGKNDTIIVSIAGQTYTVTIPPKQFDGPGLATAIQGVLNGGAPGIWTVTYDVSDISLTIACSSNFTIAGGTYIEQLITRPYVATANSVRFSYAPTLGADILYLCSPNFASLDTVGPAGQHDCLCSIIINVPYGAVQVSSMSSAVWFDCSALTTQTLSFQLRDRNYNILHIVPNISFVLTID